MEDYIVKTYTSYYRKAWNGFVSSAATCNFLYQRDFIEYHGDRFQDYSLLVFSGDKLEALLPANREENILHSHQGLSYGGLLLNSAVRFEKLVRIFRAVLQFCEKEGITNVKYKQRPFIYLRIEGMAIEHLLFILMAEVYRMDSYLVCQQSSYCPNRNRTRGIKKALKQGIYIEENKFECFWKHILVPNLKERFGVEPVHNLEEILYLKSKFPEQIRCVSAHVDGQMRAAAVLFEFEKVLHFQYSSGTDARNEDGSLDYLFDYVAKEFAHMDYISFGSSSNGSQGRALNKGLFYWKESFGAENIPQVFYNVPVANYRFLDSVWSNSKIA